VPEMWQAGRKRKVLQQLRPGTRIGNMQKVWCQEPGGDSFLRRMRQQIVNGQDIFGIKIENRRFKAGFLS